MSVDAFFQPAGDLGQRPALEMISTGAADALHPDEASRLKDVEVFHDRRAHKPGRKSFDDGSRRDGFASEGFEDLPSSGISERFPNGVVVD